MAILSIETRVQQELSTVLPNVGWSLRQLYGHMDEQLEEQLWGQLRSQTWQS